MGPPFAILSSLLMLAEQGQIVVSTGPGEVRPKYRLYDYEARCGSNLLRVRFGYDGKESGRVAHLLIDGRPVPGAAETLQIRAARRGIPSIEILDCGRGSRRPVIRGLINFDPGYSRSLGMWRSLAFRLVREGQGWRMIVDEPAGYYDAEREAEQAGGAAGPGTAGPKFHLHDVESPCGGSVFRARFRNRPTGRGRVEHVLIDGRPVPGSAKTLDRFAAGREIDDIEIMHCGMDPLRPVFRGAMRLTKPESQRYSEYTLFFRLVRQGEGWRIALD